MWVAGIEDGLFHRPAQQCGRVVDQVRVHGVITSHQHHQRSLATTARAAGLLPERSDRARETGLHHRVEATDVNAQLQCIGGGHT